jgi:hypothetical protein
MFALYMARIAKMDQEKTNKNVDDMLQQLIQAFNICLLQANQSLNIIDINASFGIAEAIFMNYRHKLRPETIKELELLINDYKKKYAECIGLLQSSADRSSYAFFYNLNELVKKIFIELKKNILEAKFR